MEWLFLYFVLAGFNVGIWTLIGFVRFLTELVVGFHTFFNDSQQNGVNDIDLLDIYATDHRISRNEVCSITAAHNEEAIIGKTLESLKKVLPPENIYVGSDGSSDDTVKITIEHGCNVVDINPNRGKAGALEYTLEHFELYDRYKAVMIVDADSVVQPTYLENALPFFNDPKVAVVAVHALSWWENHWPPCFERWYAAYRIRLYRIMQLVIRYGQSWKYFNTTLIAPGFASIYRTSVVKQIHISAPGLVIEDYNMSFEVHKKKLGRIAYSPHVAGVSQDPITFKDYAKQVKRWNLGFWQTVKKNGIWPSLFWLSTGLYIVESIWYSLFYLFTPFLFLYFVVAHFIPTVVPTTLHFFDTQITILHLLVAILLIDYVFTIIVAIYERKPILLIYGFGFFVLRYLDAVMLVYTIFLGFFKKSDGKWKSPKRKIVD